MTTDRLSQDACAHLNIGHRIKKRQLTRPLRQFIHMKTGHDLHQALRTNHALGKRIETRLNTDDSNDQQGIQSQLASTFLCRVENWHQHLTGHPVAPGDMIQGLLHGGQELVLIQSHRLNIFLHNLGRLGGAETSREHGPQTIEQSRMAMIGSGKTEDEKHSSHQQTFMHHHRDGRDNPL